MYTIAVIVGPVSFALLYKTEADWDKACEHLQFKDKESILLLDDFGQALHIKPGELKGFLAENLEQSKLARVEFALHQQRTTLLAQKMAENDVTIRTARAMQGPSVLTPFSNVGRQ